MEFVINATYTDVDSLGSYTEHETLDYNWTDEKVVVKNMVAIKEHYEVFQSYNYNLYGEKNTGDYKSKWWYNKDKCYRGEDVPYGLNLMKDDGTMFYYHCPWCGYFAHLEEIEMSIKNFKITL